MFDINKVTGGEYHAADSESEKEYKLTLIIVTLKIIAIMITENIQYLFRRLFKSPSKRENIANQLALVTGGGNGLGRAICFRLAREKCDLAIADIDYNSALKTANEIMNQYKVTCKAYQCDISNFEAIYKLKNDIESEMRGIDILVNNAGLIYVSNFFTSDVHDIKKVVEVNLTAHIVMTRTFLTGMMERKRGKIMAICSLGSVVTIPSLNVYCATKWGLNGFMQGLADELLVNDYDEHIQLTTVHPDIINTRKEAMDMIDKLNHFIPKLTPDRVANEAVEGMLKRKSKVYVSNILWLMFAIRFITKNAKKFIYNKIYDMKSLYGN